MKEGEREGGTTGTRGEARPDSGEEYEEHHVMGPWGYRVERRKKEKPPDLTLRNLLLTLGPIYMFHVLTGGPPA